MEIKVIDEKKLKAIETKLKELREFGCECTSEMADNLLVEFFPNEEMETSPLYQKKIWKKLMIGKGFSELKNMEKINDR
jgi:hypothetical protein